MIKKLFIFMFISMIFLCVSSQSYAIDFIKFGISHDEDFWGSPDNDFGPPFPSTVEFLKQRGKDQITSVELTDQNVQDAFDGDFGSFDAIVVSEGIGDPLSNQSYALINQFVSGGGCLILTGDHAEGEDEFLNNAFGYNVSVMEVQPGVDTFAIQSGAGGTQFAGGPPLLLAADLTTAFSNTPGVAIYSGTEGVGVFADQFGEGNVIAIGWDYCCTPPDQEPPILDWYEVVNRAFDHCLPPEPRPIPTLSEWGLIAMAGVLGLIGIIFFARRKGLEPKLS